MTGVYARLTDAGRAGYMDGHVRQWDMRTATVTRTFMRGNRPDAVMSLTVRQSGDI